MSHYESANYGRSACSRTATSVNTVYAAVVQLGPARVVEMARSSG